MSAKNLISHTNIAVHYENTAYEKAPSRKMAPATGAPAGLETDGSGNVISFEQRTEDDQETVIDAVAHLLHAQPAYGADHQQNDTTQK